MLSTRTFNKVFGIGLGKTGTVSLKAGLERLGLKISLYPSGNTFFKDIDESDGAVDLSISCRFEELDKKYPNSLFICPIRDLETWLKSCSVQYRDEQRWNVLGTKYRNLMFCTDIYNREKFINAYFRHEERIENYFKNRSDLLIINIIEGEGYEKICPFLGLPTINEKFPHEHKTQGI